MNDSKLIFGSPYFQFCICTEGVMMELPAMIAGIEEALEWFL